MSNVIAFVLLTLPLGAAEVRAVLEPLEQTLITSEINSTVKTINKRMGESFDEGDLLLALDDVVFAANLMKTEAQLVKAETDFSSAEQLYRDKVISHSDFRSAETAVAVARAELALARKAFDACSIEAPYAGKVVEVFVKPFERVQPGQTLIAILDDHKLIARVLIPEEFLNVVKVGDELEVRVMETGENVTATVVRLGARIDPVSSLIKMEAEIDNDDDTMRSGMEGILYIGTPERRP